MSIHCLWSGVPGGGGAGAFLQAGGALVGGQVLALGCGAGAGAGGRAGISAGVSGGVGQGMGAGVVA